MKRLFKYFIDRPLLVNLILIGIIIMGLLFSNLMKREGLPVVDMRKLTITTVYPGASPEDVELNVTIPIEEELKGVDGIKEYTSTSMENLSKIIITLDSDISDLEKVKQDIRRAVDNTKDLPEEVKDKPDIWEWKVQNFSVIEVALSSEKLNEKELVKRAKFLKKLIKNLSMVSRVDTGGIRDREIQIKVDLNKLNHFYLSFNDIIQTLQSQNINLAGGNLESYISEKGIITISRFEKIKDVENAILRSNFEGKRILLKDIATVSDTFEKKTSIIRYNGKNGVALSIVKKGNADIIRTITQIKNCVNNFKKTKYAKHVNFEYLNDLSEETRNKLKIVSSNAVIGLILVIITLFIFLNYKTAIWTAIGLPVSIFLAFIFMYISGVTFNTLSLSGIIIVLGMIVDDAIIISENIYRHHLQGKSWKEAALDGVHEVSLPVMATISTTIIAFIPILFMEGSAGDFSFEIPLVIAFTLLASLFEAFFILPQHLSHSRQKDKKQRHKKKTGNKDKKIFIWLENKYKPLIQYSLKHRYKVITLFIFLLIAAIWHAGTNMEFVMFDEEQARIFYVTGETRGGSSLQKTADDLKKVEKLIKKYPKNIIESFKTQIGLNIFGESNDANFFSIIIYMTPANIRKVTARRIVKELRNKMEDMKFIKKFHFQIDAGGPPVGRPLEIEIISNNDKELKKALIELRDIFIFKQIYPTKYFEQTVLKKIKNKKNRTYIESKFLKNKIRNRYELQKSRIYLKNGQIPYISKKVFTKDFKNALKTDSDKKFVSSVFKFNKKNNSYKFIDKISIIKPIKKKIVDGIVIDNLTRDERIFCLKQFSFNENNGTYYLRKNLKKKNRLKLKTIQDKLNSRIKIKVKELIVSIRKSELDKIRGIFTKAGVFIGTFEVDDNYEKGKDELRIRLNYDKIARFGLLSHQVAEAIRTAFNGVVVTYLQTQEERIGYRVMLSDKYRRNRKTLNLLKISNQKGQLIPIKNLLIIKEKKSIKRINHYNGDKSINVSANIDKNTTPVSVFTKLDNKLKNISKKYNSVSFKIRGEAEESAKTMASLITAFLVAIIAIYFLLVLLFNSFSQPFLVIIAIPFGLIGVILTYTLHGTNFSMFGMLGIVGLSGVVVNDSLVLIDFINNLKNKDNKKSIIKVIVEGARTRLRPILLTTLTTAAGLLPTAYGLGGYDFTVAPMVLAISWGLVFATVLTLILVPTLYMINYDIKTKLAALKGKYFKK